MKKRLLVFGLAALAALSLAACKKNNGQTGSETPSQVPVSQEYDICSMNMDDYMTLGEYKGIEVPYTLLEANEGAMQEQMEYMMAYHGDQIGLKEGEAKEGDFVNINYEGKLDGVAFEGGTAENQNVRIGEHRFIDGFEDALIGMKPGESKDANLRFPDQYNNPDLAGKEAVFTLTLNYIYPEITDEVVAAMEDADYSTKEEFEKFARDVIENEAQQTNRTGILQIAFGQIVNGCTFNEIPKVISDNQREELELRYSNAIQNGGGSLEAVIKYLYDCTPEELIDTYCKQRMAIQAIAKKEGITATDEEVDERLNVVSAQYGVTPEEYLTGMGTTKAKLKELLISEKVQNFVYDNVKVVPNN